MATSTNLLPDDFHIFSLAGIALSASIFLTVSIIYTISHGIYNLYFHPLHHIPGPFWSRASGIPYNLRMRRGTVAPWLLAAHARYGDAVRVNPNEVSFISGETAWQDIYGFHHGGGSKNGKKNLTSAAYLKDRRWFPLPLNKTWSIIASDEETHGRMRRNLSHAFSEKALKEQEGIIQGYVGLLVERLKECVEEGRSEVNVMRWYNYTTFDVIADLMFGEPLYCLRDRGYHPWVNLVFATVKAVAFIAARTHFPIFYYYDQLLSLTNPNHANKVLRMRKDFFDLSRQKVTDRIALGPTRPDFMTAILHNQSAPEKALTRDEIDSNAIIMLVAGSETSATALSGTTYLVLRDASVHARVVKEVRGAFGAAEEITMDRVARLEFLNACLHEGLRIYPPVPTGFPRVVPAGGDTISGVYVPGGTSVYVSQHASNLSPRNFKNPEVYAPERWLASKDPSSEYANDNRAAYSPFSFGPRSCLGKNLAYAEMRLILAQMLFNFDLELVDNGGDKDGKGWLDGQKVFTLWEKPDLMVRLSPVTKAEAVESKDE
ncbi:cytochrome P450 monooxygenase-like protein [Aaosphaeria arxii CBS 175.79]|uniref:Cytochrome P450 monooxygenase-like protein n=1 Tax=Aaosphaeria arxii CBS 175.79 TaxID=1450172 RepID=A0A6A5XGN3_9PLEO|nr:cytochrome P450 monooxygenase-like protein [Aaosphaeria arxii CBS 175.79]KAF2012093.1 cytochrome P450 monooxygenase-like protein [Aaosphaeria arxii CBS 175.79]